MTRRSGTTVETRDRRTRRGVAALLLLSLLPGLAPDLLGAGCPHHAVSTGPGHAAAPGHADGTSGAGPAHSGHGADGGTDHASAVPGSSDAGAPTDTRGHDVPCRCLGSCPTGSAPSLPGAPVAATVPVSSPGAVAPAVASSGLPLGPPPPFLRPWVRGPPT